ncbi:MAG TPA: hypothetical protein PLD59_12010 [Tepidisphaeraceae bacterium]|nr:hypothetical protein [Tepidisphaeraceae bacterium]
MRWANWLFFSVGLLLTAAHARGGLSNIGFPLMEEADFVIGVMNADDNRLLATAVFDDAPRRIADNLGDDIGAIDDSAVVSALSESSLSQTNAHVSGAWIDDGSISFPDGQSVPSFGTSSLANTSTRIDIATVAVPLPPAAVAGALAVMTLLGRPLVTGKWRRRHRSRPYR